MTWGVQAERPGDRANRGVRHWQGLTPPRKPRGMAKGFLPHRLPPEREDWAKAREVWISVVELNSEVLMNVPGQMSSESMIGLGMVGGPEFAIQFQEKRGQTELVFSDLIPVHRVDITDSQLEALGFVLGPRPTGKEILQPATLPNGWKKETTDHSMWSRIVDAKGRERFNVFYKAASYDHNAFMHAKRRYNVVDDYEAGEKTKLSHICVRDDADGKVLHWQIGILKEPPLNAGREEYMAFSSESRELEARAQKWLDEQYPDNKNFLAYWD